MVSFMKIFASSLATHCQDCIEPVPVPLCAGQTALYYPSAALGLTWCLIVYSLFEEESQHHVFKIPCNSQGIVLAARERWLLFRPPGDGPVYRQMHTVLEEVGTEGRKPHAFSLLWHSPLVFTGTSTCFRKCSVSTCPWRRKEI